MGLIAIGFSVLKGSDDGLTEGGQITGDARGDEVAIPHYLLVQIGRTSVDDVVLDGADTGDLAALQDASRDQHPPGVTDGGHQLALLVSLPNQVEDRLVACIVGEYAARTGLEFHEGSITHDMTRYHTFYEIDPSTPGAIIEVGFMLADRLLLTQRPDLVAQGIIDGILCFLEGEGKTLD